MKIAFYYILLLAFIVTAASCKKDNYDAPGSKLEGRIVYQGEPINVEYNQVPFELYQYGFGAVGPIGGTFDQDGSYSMLLHNGEYKLIIPNNQGPFKWKQTSVGNPDTTVIQLNGSQTLDIEVTPYYMIRNPQLAASGGAVTGSFKIEKIITDASAKNIESVNLYINKTAFVSGAGAYNVGSSSKAGSAITDPNNVSLTVTVPSAVSSTQNYVFARIGLKIAGVDDLIFSPIQKIQL
jgi:hypothetical protein